MDDLELGWRAWLDGCGDPIPLDEALHRIAVDEGATGTLAEVRASLDGLAAAIPRDTPPDRRMAGLVHHLFRVHGFRGDDQSYDDPQNSRIDRVLDRERGLPILLSAVVLEVARRIELPLQGIPFPGHFLVGTLEQPPVFLDAFHGGQLRSPAQLAKELRTRTETRPSASDLRQALAPASTADLLLRVSTNLMHSWLRREDPVRALRNADRRVAIRPDAPELLRDRAGIRIRLGHVEPAAFDLATYLDLRPDAPDAAGVRWVLSTLPLGR